MNELPKLDFKRLTLETALLGILTGLGASKVPGVDVQTAVFAGLTTAGVFGGARASNPPAKKPRKPKKVN